MRTSWKKAKRTTISALSQKGGYIKMFYVSSHELISRLMAAFTVNDGVTVCRSNVNNKLNLDK